MNDNVEILNSKFPSNAHRKKEEKLEPKKVEKVIKGRVLQKKKSFGKKLVETFIGEDINSVGSYILYDVLIPAAKSTISDMVQGGIEMLLFGERKGSRTKRDGNRSFVNYGGMSSSSSYRREERYVKPQIRNTHNFDDIVLANRGEAEQVLSHLVDLVIDYGQASVADLYDLVGITSNFTDNKYGWDDLSSASVSRSREGYLLNLPKPITLN